jgi:hypothetical protein
MKNEQGNIIKGENRNEKERKKIRGKLKFTGQIDTKGPLIKAKKCALGVDLADRGRGGGGNISLRWEVGMVFRTIYL